MTFFRFKRISSFRFLFRKFLFNTPSIKSLFLCLILVVLSKLIYRFSRKVFRFELTPMLPFMSGHDISDDGKKISSNVALLLQGPAAPNVDYKKYFALLKDVCGIGAVIYSGQDSRLIELADYSEFVEVDRADNQFKKQRLSTLSALKISERLGFKYSLKCRADSFFTRKDFVLYFLSIYKTFPNNFLVIEQQKPSYYPFMSDHVQFAETVDLKKVWELNWNGDTSYDKPYIKGENAPTPEWALGENYHKVFPAGRIFSVCASSVGYIFPKYDFYDIKRFDYESVPHFGKNNIPNKESNISGVESVILSCMPSSVYSENVGASICESSRGEV